MTVQEFLKLTKKEQFHLLEKFQDTLSDDYNFKKYENYYSEESCCDEGLAQDGESIVFTWTYEDYDGPQYGMWFVLTSEDVGGF